MLTLLYILAEVDPISGGAGWAGAGLLGLVLAWLLLKHLPDKDAQVQELIKSHNENLAEVIQRHSDTQAELRKTFSDAIDKVTDHCREEMERLLNAIRK